MIGSMSGRQRLTEFFEADFPLNREGLGAFVAAFTAVRIPKGSMLLSEGATQTKLRFVTGGAVRVFSRGGGGEANSTSTSRRGSSPTSTPCPTASRRAATGRLCRR